MSKIVWDAVGDRFYETGVDNGVLYPYKDGAYQKGVAWNGLTAVTESPEGAEANPIYADNIKYLNLMSNEDFKCTIEAYTYPEEFEECDGSAAIATGVTIGQQKRIPFAFSYRTKLGNDTDGSDYGYKLHIVYGCMAAPTEKGYATVNDSPEAITFSWEVTTTPIDWPGYKPSAHIEIDSRKADATSLTALENYMYGTDASQGQTGTDAALPLPSKILELFASTVTVSG